MNKVLVVDPSLSGISGDMLLGALVDLGADRNKITVAISEIPNYVKNCEALELEIEEVLRCGLRGIKTTIKSKETLHRHRTGGELKKTAEKLLDEIDFSDKAKNFVEGALLTILTTEAKLHSSTIEETRLHETGFVDTLADVVGVAVALDNLGILEGVKVYSLPVCVGKGRVKTSHGILSVPTPATLEILASKNFPFIGSETEAELATPTGVSMLTYLDEAVEFYPPMNVSKVGYGAGSKDLPYIPNLLRIVIGQLSSRFSWDEIYIIETNVDDISGEVIGYLIEKLLEEGAKDAYVTTSIGKKGRPVFTIKTLVDREKLEYMTALISKETGSLGLRVYRCDRYILQRQSVPTSIEVSGKIYSVQIKIGRNHDGKIIQVKPEFEDVKKIASETSMPLREVMDKARRKGEELIQE